VADVQLRDLGDLGHRADIAGIEAVTGGHLQTELGREARRIAQPLQLPHPLCGLPLVAVVAGVQLDGRGAGPHRGLDLLRRRIDEQGDDDPSSLQACRCLAHRLELPLHVEAALGGPLLPLLGDEGHPVGDRIACDLDHLGGRGHLQVEQGLDRLAQQAQVAVLDVTTVLAQVDRDLVGTSGLGHGRGHHGLWIRSTTSLSQRSHMVHIDTQPQVL